MGDRCSRCGFCEVVIDHFEIQKGIIDKKIAVIEDKAIYEQLEELKLQTAKEEDLKAYNVYRNSIKEVEKDIDFLQGIFDESKAKSKDNNDADLINKELKLHRTKQVFDKYSKIIAKKDQEIEILSNKCEN